MGVNPKIGFFSPQIMNFNRLFHYKPSILGGFPPIFGNTQMEMLYTFRWLLMVQRFQQQMMLEDSLQCLTICDGFCVFQIGQISEPSTGFQLGQNFRDISLCFLDIICRTKGHGINLCVYHVYLVISCFCWGTQGVSFRQAAPSDSGGTGCHVTWRLFQSNCWSWVAQPFLG